MPQHDTEVTSTQGSLGQDVIVFLYGEYLLEVVEDRYQLGATIVASQCPIGDWHPNLGDPTLADAICDRLLHNAYRIELRGDSMRTRAGSTSKNEGKEAVADDGKMS